MSRALLQALQNPALYPHPVEAFQVIETHISWVLLTGPYAYKIKKPVNFGFLDFTDIEQRRHFCAEELRLNARLTRGLYLDVLPISGSEEAPLLGDASAPIEYVLKMRQFPQSQLLAEVQARGELQESHIDALARQIAEFHAQTPAVPLEHPLCSAEAIVAPMYQNFEQMRPLLSEARDLQQLDALEDWTRSSIERLQPLLEQRARNGSVRECHGDLHLGNATLLDGEPVLFDCIEFNEEFRFNDIGLDAAFLAMDLEDRGLKCLSRRFISQWLELTGDYQALPLLSLYKAYRALVRAKINLFRLGQEEDKVQRAVIMRQYRALADLAESYSNIPSRFLAITYGVSAVGKSHVALRLVESLGAIRVRSDLERKRLFPDANPDTRYSAEATEATYARLQQIAQIALTAGYPVVLDATYLKHAPRQQARAIAEETGVPFIILDCQAPEAVIAEWLEQRRREALDPSEATLEVVRAQQAGREALSDEELPFAGVIRTDDAASLDGLVGRLRDYLPGL